MKLPRFIRRNQGSIAFGLLTVGSIALNYPSIQAKQKEADALKNQIASNNQRTESLRQSREFEIEQAKIAEDRYLKGGVPVVSLKNPRKYTSLQEGKPVIDQVSRKPLPNGTIVVDALGNTGVIVDGVVLNMAFTGNQQVIRNRLKNYRGAQFSQPVN